MRFNCYTQQPAWAWRIYTFGLRLHPCTAAFSDTVTDTVLTVYIVLTSEMALLKGTLLYYFICVLYITLHAVSSTIAYTKGKAIWRHPAVQ